MSEKETETVSRCIKIDDWIFEIKTVRAIRVEEYGQPYSAIANINLNGDNAYIDGLLTKSSEELAIQDFNTLKEYFKRLGVKQIQFDRYKNDQVSSRSHDVSSFEKKKKTKTQPLQLVSVG